MTNMFNMMIWLRRMGLLGRCRASDCVKYLVKIKGIANTKIKAAEYIILFLIFLVGKV